jgi:hypothetical protein
VAAEEEEEEPTWPAFPHIATGIATGAFINALNGAVAGGVTSLAHHYLVPSFLVSRETIVADRLIHVAPCVAPCWQAYLSCSNNTYFLLLV